MVKGGHLRVGLSLLVACLNRELDSAAKFLEFLERSSGYVLEMVETLHSSVLDYLRKFIPKEKRGSCMGIIMTWLNIVNWERSSRVSFTLVYTSGS